MTGNVLSQTMTYTTTVTTVQSHRIPILDIPELTAEVARHLGFYDYVQCLLVSKTFYNAFRPLIWKDFEPPLVQDIEGSFFCGSERYVPYPPFDPSVIYNNLPFIRNLSLSVADHERFLPIFTDGFVGPTVASPFLFFRKQVLVSSARRLKYVDKAEITPLTATTTLPSSLSTLSSAMNCLHFDNQPRCTNLTTLSVSYDKDMSSLTPKHHLILQSNIRTLILHNPNIKTLRIPADLLALHPKLLFDILEHHLPYLEQLELGPLTSKSYTYSPSSAQDCADLGLENDSSDSGNRDGNRDNVVKTAYFSGTIDWEITVQLLETCLWKRPAITNNNNNKPNTHLLKLRCRYHIHDNVWAIPESVLESQLDRLCPLSPTTTTTTTSSSSSSSSSTYSAGDDDNGDKIQEPRLTYLGLPLCGSGEPPYWNYFYSTKGVYPTYIVLPLLDQLPYLAELFPHSWVEKLPEDEFDEDAAAAIVAENVENSSRTQDITNIFSRPSGSRAPRGRGRRGKSSYEGKEKKDVVLRPRYRWREVLCRYMPSY